MLDKSKSLSVTLNRRTVLDAKQFGHQEVVPILEECSDKNKGTITKDFFHYEGRTSGKIRGRWRSTAGCSKRYGSLPVVTTVRCDW